MSLCKCACCGFLVDWIEPCPLCGLVNSKEECAVHGEEEDES